MIRKLNEHDALKTAQLHKEGMPRDFLPSFGFYFLFILHQELLKSKDIIALGYEYKNILSGCVIATTNTKLIMYQTIKTGIRRLFLPIIISVIKNPVLIYFIYQTLIYGNKVRVSDAELLIISVDKNVRKQKIGTKLMQALKRKFDMLNIKTFQVNALSTNKPANNYYEKMGGKFIRSISIYNRVWNTYLFTL